MRLGETDYLGCMLINGACDFSGWTRVVRSTLLSVTNRGSGESNSSALFSREVSQKLAYLLLMRYYSARVNLNTKVLDFE